MDNMEKLAALQAMQRALLDQFNNDGIGSSAVEIASAFAQLVTAEVQLVESDYLLKNRNEHGALTLDTPTNVAGRSFKPPFG